MQKRRLYMLFSSTAFLYYFLPFFLILYFAFPKKLRNFILLLGSLVFYAFGEPKYVILMIFSIILSFVFGLLIEKAKSQKLRKLWLILSVCSGVLMLGYFKYADFLVSNISAVFGLNLPVLKIALPIGISFYSFQTMSYTIDVYRRQTTAQKNIISYGAYVASFPQLIAGPIVRYTDIEKELETRESTTEKFYLGISRFIIGLSKKVLIANVLGELCSIFRESNEKTVLFYWVYAIAFSLHIYFDFSGYSDMAIGLGKIFGFNFPENFNYPFISKSITEFWRRWHITLGSWFRDYVYIPMGGNRVKPLRWLFNIFTVWMLTGLWHGAEWNFVLWGLFFAVWLCSEKLFLKKLLDRIPSFLSNIYVLFLVLISFVIFNASGASAAFYDIGGLFGANGLSLSGGETLYYLRSYAAVLYIAAVGSTPLLKMAVNKLKALKTPGKIINVLEPVVLAALLILCTAYLVDGSYNPFLYFRF